MNEITQIKFSANDFKLVELNHKKLFELYEPLLPKGAASEDSLIYQMRINFERNFIVHVVANLSRLLSEHPDAVILWDIDEVIGRNNQNKEDRTNVDFEIRPAFPVLFDRIKETFPESIFGMITTGRKQHFEKVLLSDELHSNNVSIEKYFNKDFVFSVREILEDANEELFPEATDEFFCSRKSEYRIIKDLDSRQDSAKTIRIIALKMEHPSKKFILIDDLRCANVLGGITIDKNTQTYRSVFEGITMYRYLI